MNYFIVDSSLSMIEDCRFWFQKFILTPGCVTNARLVLFLILSYDYFNKRFVFEYLHLSYIYFSHSSLVFLHQD